MVSPILTLKVSAECIKDEPNTLCWRDMDSPLLPLISLSQGVSDQNTKTAVNVKAQGHIEPQSKHFQVHDVTCLYHVAAMSDEQFFSFFCLDKHTQTHT